MGIAQLWSHTGLEFSLWVFKYKFNFFSTSRATQIFLFLHLFFKHFIFLFFPLPPPSSFFWVHLDSSNISGSLFHPIFGIYWHNLFIISPILLFHVCGICFISYIIAHIGNLRDLFLSLTRGLSIVLIFSKNQLLVSLIFPYCLSVFYFTDFSS